MIGHVLYLLTSFGLSWALVQCDLSQVLKDEIKSYQPTVDLIVSELINGPRSGVLYSDLADFLDKFGHRLAGSENLERAIDDIIKRQEAKRLAVSTHALEVPKWTRGESLAAILKPRYQLLNHLTLGNTPATPKEGITAQVIVVKSFEELEAMKDEVADKIVLFNAQYVSYAETGVYRNQGPNRASQLGAAAVLVRSITPFSINSPHTGNTYFDDETTPIPAAAITLENANLMARLVASGKNVTVHFKSSARNEGSATSRNVIGDIPGMSKPEEYVVISGHIDSWDVGQGAMDDAAGAFLAWHSLAFINDLGLPPPARTIRSIMWTAEEQSALGAAAYRKDREAEGQNWTVAFESDVGVWNSAGIGFSGTDSAACIMQEIVSLFTALNATEINRLDVVGSDISAFQDLGVPLGEPYSKEDNYFWFHHSDGDWIDVLKTADLDQNLAIFSSTTYIMANLSITLPRN